MTGGGPDSIKVHLNEIRQLFNSMDPSPFRERDLDPACEEFIVSWAREFPPEQPLRIEIRVDREPADETLRVRIPNAVQAHFEREAELQSLKLRRSIREGRLSLAIGIVFLSVCVLGASFLPGHNLGTAGNVLAESLIIAGWVAMWHPMEVLLYGLWPLARERRLLERLARAEVALAGTP